MYKENIALIHLMCKNAFMSFYEWAVNDFIEMQIKSIDVHFE